MVKITAIIEQIQGFFRITPTNRADFQTLKNAAKGIPMCINIGQYRRPDRNKAWWTALAFFAEHCNESDPWQGKTDKWLHNAVQLSFGHTEIFKLDDRTVEIP